MDRKRTFLIFLKVFAFVLEPVSFAVLLSNTCTIELQTTLACGLKKLQGSFTRTVNGTVFVSDIFDLLDVM